MAKIRKQKQKKSRKMLWAIAVLIALPVGFNLLSLTMAKRYTAEMRIMVDETSQSIQPGSGAFGQIDNAQLSSRPRSPQTQLDVLTGTIVLENALKMAVDRFPNKLSSNEDASAAYDNLVRRLAVDNEPLSDILSVKVTEDDPEVAAELANDIGLSYIDYTKRLGRQASSALSDQLKLKIDPLKAQLKKIDAQIDDIKTKSNVQDVATSEANMGSTKEIADRTLASALANYDGAQAQLVVAQNVLKGIPMYIRSATHTQANPLMVSLQTSLATERVQLAQLRAQYQDGFPAVKEERQKIADLEKQVKSADKSIEAGQDMSLNPLYQSQQSTVAQYQAQAQSFAGQLSAARAEQQRSTNALGKIPEAEKQLQSLIRDRTVDEQTYEQLEQRLSMLQSDGATLGPTDEIVSTALPPSMPSFPDHKLLTMAGLALGVFFAVLILMPRPEMVVPEAVEPEPTNTNDSGNASPPQLPNGREKTAKSLRRANAKALTSDEHEALAAMPLHIESNETPETSEPLDPAQSLSRALRRANEAKPWVDEAVADAPPVAAPKEALEPVEAHASAKPKRSPTELFGAKRWAKKESVELPPVSTPPDSKPLNPAQLEDVPASPKPRRPVVDLFGAKRVAKQEAADVPQVSMSEEASEPKVAPASPKPKRSAAEIFEVKAWATPQITELEADLMPEAPEEPEQSEAPEAEVPPVSPSPNPKRSAAEIFGAKPWIEEEAAVLPAVSTPEEAIEAEETPITPQRNLTPMGLVEAMPWTDEEVEGLPVVSPSQESVDAEDSASSAEVKRSPVETFAAKPWTDEEVAGLPLVLPEDEPMEPPIPAKKRSFGGAFKRSGRSSASDGAQLA